MVANYCYVPTLNLFGLNVGETEKAYKVLSNNGKTGRTDNYEILKSEVVNIARITSIDGMSVYNYDLLLDEDSVVRILELSSDCKSVTISNFDKNYSTKLHDRSEDIIFSLENKEDVERMVRKIVEMEMLANYYQVYYDNTFSFETALLNAEKRMRSISHYKNKSTKHSYNNLCNRCGKELWDCECDEEEYEEEWGEI